MVRDVRSHTLWLFKSIVRNVRSHTQWLSNSMVRNVRSLTQWLPNSMVRNVRSHTLWLSKSMVRNVRSPTQWLSNSMIRNVRSLTQWLSNSMVRNVRSHTQWLSNSMVRNVRSHTQWFVILNVKSHLCLYDHIQLLENILLPLLLFTSNCSKPSEYCIELEWLEEVVELDKLVAWDEAGVRVGWLCCLYSSKEAIGFRLAPVGAGNFFNILSDG